MIVDRIYIEDLEVFANHGVYKEEKKLGQKFLISAEIFIDLQQSGLSDNLNETVNYGLLCCEIEELFTKDSYDLIEKVAEQVVDNILLKYEDIQRMKLKVKKPWAPIGKPIKYAAVQIDRTKHTVYIGIGSNIGDKNTNLQQAIEKLNNNNLTKVTKVSKFYITKPYGYLEQDDFLNCAIEVETLLTPSKLMKVLLDIEKQLKRKRTIKWGPRIIDLDILLYDDLILSKNETIIPHPLMHDRMFVLEPLSEIAPYAFHPVLNKRIFQLKEELKNKEGL
ncbi:MULTISPECIES: 2-amino-4-hydroxy-6-hydroxymethyldihydropteridine diphosphokinase [Clostridium]|uniref:2-amino-4-hydroxy-6- hydroxymethyldihydropteridine diphosphokinase n=1 Tax=Clostridium massiliodielmoense TaxID=1776385 RepID=UPI0009B2B24C